MPASRHRAAEAASIGKRTVGTPIEPRVFVIAAVTRWLALVLVWVALAGIAPLGLVVGMLAAAMGTAVSLRLLPPRAGWPRFNGLASLLVHFFSGSLVAGVDVAARALATPVRLAPGFIDHPVPFASGLKRSAFRALASLQPGALPIADRDDGRLVVHHLDVRGPVLETFAREVGSFEATCRRPGS